MRISFFVALAGIIAIPGVASAQSADQGLVQLPREKTATQVRFEKAADSFGDCVVRRDPNGSAEYIRQRAAGADAAGIIQPAIGKCLPSRDSAYRDFVVQEADVAILRAVERAN